MFDPSVFMPAFKDAGMLVQATRLQLGTSFDCGFIQPDEPLFGEEALSAQIRIEFETSAADDLAIGETLEIGTDLYRVRSPARRQGDGYFSTVDLERIR